MRRQVGLKSYEMDIMKNTGKRKPHGHKLVVKPQDHISSFSLEQNVIDTHSKKKKGKTTSEKDKENRLWG